MDIEHVYVHVHVYVSCLLLAFTRTRTHSLLMLILVRNHSLLPSLQRAALYAVGAYTKLSSDDVISIITSYQFGTYISHKELNGGLSNR